jgi:hypothetical protein
MSDNEPRFWADIQREAERARAAKAPGRLDPGQLDPGRLYTVAEAADYLRVGPSSIRRWLHRDTDPLGFFRLPTGGVRISGIHIGWFLSRSGSSVAAEQLELEQSGGPYEEDDPDEDE